MFFSNMKDSLPLLTGILAALATLAAVIVTSLFNIKVARLNIEAQSRQRAKELRLEKLEELFFLFDKWQLTVASIYLLHLRNYKGLLSYEQVLDRVSQPSLINPGDPQKYKTILHIHFPSALESYATVDRARDRLVPFLSDPKLSKLNADDFEARQVDFDAAAESFKVHLRSLAPVL